MSNDYWAKAAREARAAYNTRKEADEITRLRAENEKLREALIDTTASLVASVSLLERGGKKAAPSDKMFAQMLVDYKNSIDRARAAIECVTDKKGAVNE